MPKTLRKTSPIRGGARKSRQLIKASDVSEAEAQRLAKAVLDTMTQISGPRMAGARWPNFGKNRQRRSKRLMGGNMSSGPKTRRRKNWTRERREFTELNGETADKVERKIAGNMRHRPTVYQCLRVCPKT